MKNITAFLITLIGGLVIASSVYWILRIGGADDAGFFTSILTVAMIVGFLASPCWNVFLGLKRLWLMDWIPVVVAPFLILSIAPNQPILMAGARYICFFTFFLAGAISARRFFAHRP